MGKTARSICAFLLAVFACQKVALPQTPNQESPPRRALQVSALFIPPELGQVSQVHDVPPEAARDPKQLIVIQDAHVNYEAQKHLAEILERLISAYGITRIFVEGGEGDVSLSLLRERGSQAVLEQLAEEYLKAGALSGEEYLDMVSEHPLTLWGVDDAALYDEQFTILLETEQERKAAGQQLAQLRQVMERLRAQGSNEALRAFEAHQAAFEAGQLGFRAYMDGLLAEGERVGVAVEAFPNLWRLISASRLEAGLDLQQVEQEQQQALGRLRPRVSAQQWATLKGVAEGLQAGEVDPAVFYDTLASLAGQAGVPLTDFPHLQQYLRYLQLKASAQPQAWLAELAQVQGTVKAHLAGASADAELMRLADRLARCERLAALEWTPEDYQAALAAPDQLRVSAWLPGLKEHAARLGVEMDWKGDPVMLEGSLARAVRFYDLAVRRDEQIARRVLEQMDAQAQQAAVLITGGFHTDHVIRLLAARGVRTAVVTPWAGEGADSSRYAEILKSKYQNRMRRATGEPRGRADVAATPTRRGR